MLGVKQPKAMDQLMFWGWKPFWPRRIKMCSSAGSSSASARAPCVTSLVYYKVPADSPGLHRGRTPHVRQSATS